ncbi:ArsR family transcriptional regulator [bacterium]|nr:ArsR family transcriptional regulator [bacterium]
MGLLDFFDRFIVEHGSAKIQEKHIALLKEQVTVFDRKFLLLESDNRDFRAENEKLKANNLNLKEQNIELEKKLKNYEQPTHDSPLDEIEVKILVHLAKREARTTAQISEEMKISEPIIAFHVEEMKGKGMVTSEHVPTLGDCWYLEQKGRKYLIVNKLIT